MTIIFSFPEYQNLAQYLSSQTGFELGESVFRNFPEGESYVKIQSDVKNKKVILVCGLEYANQKIMAIMFFAKAAKEFGATSVNLVSPYLGYMRMDKRFEDGEAITSNLFAQFLSQQIDSLITIDPHLHRHKTLEEIYSIPCQTLHANIPISAWIKNNVNNPLIIGPDSESQQWAGEIASLIGAPVTVLQKIRRGDYDVEVSIPQIEKYQDHTPVIVDDIISTAKTMIEAVKHIKTLNKISPICIGVHAIFVGNSHQELKDAGVSKIVTCNTITHESNGIDIKDLIVAAIYQTNPQN